LHLVRFRHPLDQFAAAREWDLGPFPRPGDGETVNATSGENFAQTGGASYREIFDVGEWDHSLAVNTPGQSGDPKSAHYKDLLPLWLKGDYFPLLFSRGAIEKNLEQKLDLVPAHTP
jgi:penicillin G amidase